MSAKDIKKGDEKKENFFISRIKSSVIVRGLMKVASKIYHATFSSVAAKVLSEEDKVGDGLPGSAMEQASDSPKSRERARNFKNAFSRRMEQSKILVAVSSVGNKMMRASISSYGVFLFTIGLYFMIIHAVKLLALRMTGIGNDALVIGGGAIAVGLICFASSRSLYDAISTSAIIGKVFFSLLGVRRPNDEDYGGEAQRYVAVPFIIGTILGAASAVVRPTYIALGLLLAALVIMVLKSPEAGLVGTFLVLPFAKTMHLVALIILIFVSFLIKFMCGRRTIRFALIDVFVLLFAAMTMSGGLFAVGSGALKRSLVYVCFIGGYFLVKMALGSQKFSRRAMYALSIACAVVSIIGIVEYFIGSPSAIWQDRALFSDIRGRVVSTFQNPNVLGEYLVLTIPVCAALVAAEDNFRRRFFFFISALLGISCLVLTWSRGAWLGLIFAAALTLLFVSRKWLVGAVLAIPVGAVGLAFAGGKVMARLLSVTNFSDSSTAYRINIWKSTLDMLKDTFFFGIGTGAGAFESVFPFYALPGLTKVEHSHSLYLQITVETGIFSLIVFLMIVFLFIKRALSFERHAISGKNRYIAAGLFCGILAFLLQGFTDFVFYNYRVALMFWMTLGLIMAHISASRDSAEEHVKTQ